MGRKPEARLLGSEVRNIQGLGLKRLDQVTEAANPDGKYPYNRPDVAPPRSVRWVRAAPRFTTSSSVNPEGQHALADSGFPPTPKYHATLTPEYHHPREFGPAVDACTEHSSPGLVQSSVHRRSPNPTRW